MSVEPPLGPTDLCMVMTSDELMAITAFIGGDLNLHPSMLRLVHRDGSPWIEFQAVPRERVQHVPALQATLLHEPQRFAFWRHTLAVYRIGDDGAVEDDPIWTLTGGHV